MTTDCMMNLYRNKTKTGARRCECHDVRSWFFFAHQTGARRLSVYVARKAGKCGISNRRSQENLEQICGDSLTYLLQELEQRKCFTGNMCTRQWESMFGGLQIRECRDDRPARRRKLLKWDRGTSCGIGVHGRVPRLHILPTRNKFKRGKSKTRRQKWRKR